MPLKSELPPVRRESKITVAQRQELIETIIEKIEQETDPRWVFHPAWESIEPYTSLIPMIGLLEADSPLTRPQDLHLRKVAAWQAHSINRRKITGMKGYNELWAIVDTQLGSEMAQIAGFPEDLSAVPSSWKSAFVDQQKIASGSLQKAQ